MNKYKVCVYAICKNESKHIKRWYESMKEADEIYVLDTGSTDGSQNILKELNINYKEEKIIPWRFDVARNKSLEMVPDDCNICVCTDLDEVFNKGWRSELERVWNNKINCVKYQLNFSFDEYGNPATTLYISKIHSRHGFKWVHMIHEVLDCDERKEAISNKIVLNHYPDPHKSRSNYLELLEQSIIDEPDSDRNLHYLGREYMYNNEHLKCIETLHKHLNHPNATWKEERAASMRYIARSYSELNYKEEAEYWYKKAINEAPKLREGYVELGYLYYKLEDYKNAYDILNESLKIKSRSQDYINEDFCWNSFIYDLLSICAYKLGRTNDAYKYINEAVKLDKDNLRLLNNLDIISEKIKKD